MTKDEIVRRLKALIAIAPKLRPISVDKLEHVAGIADNEVHKIAKRGTMQEKTRVRLERALLLVENDQLVFKRGVGTTFPPTPAKMTIRDPKPPQVNVQRVEFTENGPRIRFVATNPRAFPDLQIFTKRSK
jgi:hypothetical protein